MPKRFLGKRLLVLTAHPDDEGIAAGTMHENYKAGGESFLICATLGEKGKSHLERPVTDAALKRIRRRELLAAAKVLHVKKVFFLGLPDTGLRERKSALYEKCLAIVRAVAPDQMVSFGPDGGTGHLDHIAVGRAALRIARELGIPLAAVTFARAGLARRRKFLVARRRFGKYSARPAKHRKGDITITIDPAVKRRAMRNHVSQFGRAGTPFANLPKRVQQRMMNKERFVDERTGETFKARVYAVVAKIPRGRTMTYREVARRAGNPRAYRAVGNIMNRNPDTKRVPCHRVVRSSGDVGGYASGKAKKIALLKREGAI